MKNRLIEAYPLHDTRKKDFSDLLENSDINSDILKEDCVWMLTSFPKLQQPLS